MRYNIDKIVVFFSFILLSCSNEDDSKAINMGITVKNEPVSIAINTYRDIENIDQISMFVPACKSRH